jgi:hypothetical protein
MKLFSFTNMYLSGLQAGLQTAHAVAALFRKYPHTIGYEADIGNCCIPGSLECDHLIDWADNFQTIIILNGGSSEELSDLSVFLSHQNEYPYVQYRESEEAANNLLTCVAIVVPEKLCVSSNKPISIGAEDMLKEYSSWDLEFLTRKSKCDLAR